MVWIVVEQFGEYKAFVTPFKCEQSDQDVRYLFLKVGEQLGEYKEFVTTFKLEETDKGVR